ncbi:MAG: glycosyltransferase [Terracidiphilus sp.]|nr:glycosyltransferase [Terracidiphilus sp.]
MTNEQAAAHSIPRRVIQTAKTPPHTVRLQAFAANLRLLHPDFEFLFFDNAAVQQFVDSEFPEYRAVFDGFRYPIQRYDFFRYLAVYRLGGFYFDFDVLLAKSLEPLLSSGCVFPFEQISLNPGLRAVYGMDWELGNYAFAASAGHPFLKAVIDNCVRGQKDPGWVSQLMGGLPPLLRREYFVLCSTGPGLVSRTYAENPGLAAGVRVLFPGDVRDRSGWNGFGEYGVHLMDGEWRPGKGPIRRRLERVWVDWLRSRALRESAKLGPARNTASGGSADK